jgi:hypothetical protein
MELTVNWPIARSSAWLSADGFVMPATLRTGNVIVLQNAPFLRSPRGITMADFSLGLLFPEEQQSSACSLRNSKQRLSQG